jgi:SAM-dependent methyltransferase
MTTKNQLPDRDRSEIERSAAEAKKTLLEPFDPSEIERYLSPPADTAYALEYAYYLLGNVRGKTVLDVGCGTGENIIPLVERGARVIGVDISPELIALAQDRVKRANLCATILVGSAYETGLPDASVDVVFCMSLIHHLDIARFRDEMYRILVPDGAIILKEPIRFSRAYAKLRSLLPDRDDISDYEHPVTRDELSVMTLPFQVEGTRYFRLPIVPVVGRIFPPGVDVARMTSDWLLRHIPATNHYATAIVMKLQK